MPLNEIKQCEEHGDAGHEQCPVHMRWSWLGFVKRSHFSRDLPQEKDVSSAGKESCTDWQLPGWGWRVSQKCRILQSGKELRGKLMQRFLATLPLLAATIFFPQGLGENSHGNKCKGPGMEVSFLCLRKIWEGVDHARTLASG